MSVENADMNWDGAEAGPDEEEGGGGYDSDADLEFLFLGSALAVCLEAGKKRKERLQRKRPVPLRTSSLSGEMYIREVLASPNPRRCLEVLRMEKQAFVSLAELLRSRSLLQDSWSNKGLLSVEQQLGIFLFIVSTASSNRVTQERFQQGAETISTYFHKVLNALNKLAPEFIQQPGCNGEAVDCPIEIQRDPKMYPFFEDCVGAMDGTLIHASVAEKDSATFRCRKGFIAQNVMATVGFDLRFHYLLPGYAGSATDSQMLSESYSYGWRIPAANKYYLADAGYPLRPHILIPYPATRYHLKEWERSGKR